MPKYAEEILAAVTELQQHPTAEQVFLEMKTLIKCLGKLDIFFRDGNAE